jgi:hypothetical protein
MTSEEEEEYTEHAIDLQTKLVYKNQQKFNEQYDYTNNLNKSIMTKDRLINSVKDINKVNNRNLNILSSTLLLIFLSIIIGVLIYYKILSISGGKYIIIIFIVVYLYKTYIEIKYQYRDFSKESEITSKELDKTLQNYYEQKKIEDNKYSCPNEYSIIENESNENDNYNKDNMSELVPYKRYMNTDSSRDVWKYGSSVDTLYTSEDEPSLYKSPTNLPTYRMSDEEDIYEPQPWVDGGGVNSKNGIFYDCKWEGGDDNTFAPIQKSYENSTIPCQYLPGFKTDSVKVCEIEDENLINCNLVK